MKKMYSASEIMGLHLPNMPLTKAAIIKRAEKEEWVFAEETGLGGIRRLYEIPARYLVSVETMGLPLDTALQAALSAHKAANAMGGISDEQFLGLFKTLCGIMQTEDRPSMSHNARHKVKTGANSNVVTGDSNIQIVKGSKNGK